MGIKLVEEVMDYAPDTLTTGEWKGFIVLARDANEQTRLTYNGVNSPEILRRVRMSVAAWSNLRSALIRKGVLEVASAGVKGRSAVYRIPSLKPAILHPTDEESSDGPGDLHPVDEESDPMLHPTDEESAGFFIQQMTPTPLSTPQLLSPPRPRPASDDAPAPSRERSNPATNNSAPTQSVIAAYAAALGRPVTRSTREKIIGHAEGLISAGYPAAWIEDRAREMAAKGWTDLEQHAARSTVPLPGVTKADANTRPPHCGECHPRTRMVDEDTSPRRCPRCHPLNAHAA